MAAYHHHCQNPSSFRRMPGAAAAATVETAAASSWPSPTDATMLQNESYRVKSSTQSDSSNGMMQVVSGSTPTISDGTSPKVLMKKSTRQHCGDGGGGSGSSSSRRRGVPRSLILTQGHHDIYHPNPTILKESKKALLENDAMVYLDGPQVYTCANCRTHLTSHDDIISKSFHGRNGMYYHTLVMMHFDII